MSICADAMSAAPLGSENANVKVCAAPLPEFGVTDTAAGPPPLLPPVMVSEALTVTPEYLAVNVTGVEALTLPVDTVKVAEVAPGGTVTDAGTLAAEEFELDSVTTAPPEGAGAVRLTEPAPDWPPAMLPGDTEIPLSAARAGFTVKPKVSLAPPKDAVKVTGVAVATLPAVTGKVVAVEPFGTVAVDGMLTSVGDELKLIVAPPFPGAEVSATVHVEPTVGLTATGLQVKPFKLGPCTIVTVPLPVKVDNGVPVALAEVPFVSWTSEDVPWVDADSVKLTVATTLFASVMSFRPHSRHIADPPTYWQDSDLFAAPGPATTVIDEKSVVE